ncbi:MAG: hypothetical protein AAGH48_02155, partial [Pseudomonadota bacterium]
HDPKYLALISLDEPKADESTHGYATAGWNAAPVAASVVKRLGPVLGVQPTWRAYKDAMGGPAPISPSLAPAAYSDLVGAEAH